MAIFNEGKVTEWIKKWIDKENERLCYNKSKAGKSDSNNESKDESYKKKKGLLTEQDINNGISIIKRVFSANSKLGKYMEYYPMKEIMDKYSKSGKDDIQVAKLHLTDPDDIDNQDVLIPSPDADWYKGDSDKLSNQIHDLIDKLCTKIEAECTKKYGDEIEFGYSSSYYAFFFYICSKKPKESSDDKLKE